MKTFSTAIDIQAPAERVWAVMRDVTRWHEWTPTITSVTLEHGGALGVGARARIRQPKLPPASWDVTAIDEGVSFTWVSRGPGILVTARHAVAPVPGGCRVTLSLTFTGPLGPAFGWMTRGINNRYLGLEAAGLKARCEAVS